MIPEIQLEEIIGDHFNRNIFFRELPYEDGQLPDDQLRVLLSILITENPAEILEIGTFFGHTTVRMAEALPASVIHTVDLPVDFHAGAPAKLMKTDFHLIMRRDNLIGREFIGSPARQRIIQHYGDTVTWDFHEAGHPTFFFIDGSHSYDYCRNDSMKCLDLCNGRGVFIWHNVDENHMGVVRFLEEWRLENRDVRLIAGTPLGYLSLHPAHLR
jgi:methyltransferase family protein